MLARALARCCRRVRMLPMALMMMRELLLRLRAPLVLLLALAALPLAVMLPVRLSLLVRTALAAMPVPLLLQVRLMQLAILLGRPALLQVAAAMRLVVVVVVRAAHATMMCMVAPMMMLALLRNCWCRRWLL